MMTVVQYECVNWGEKKKLLEFQFEHSLSATSWVYIQLGCRQDCQEQDEDDPRMSQGRVLRGSRPSQDGVQSQDRDQNKTSNQFSWPSVYFSDLSSCVQCINYFIMVTKISVKNKTIFRKINAHDRDKSKLKCKSAQDKSKSIQKIS